MKVGTSGGSWMGREDILPKDATVYRELDAWILSLSKQEKCLIIDTKDYHPGLLFLSKEDLEEMIKALGEQSSSELSQQLDQAKQEANELRQRLEQAEQEANHDMLTGLYSRQYFDKALRALYAEYRQGEAPFSVIIMDIDFLLNINEAYGEKVGDCVLKSVGHLIIRSMKGRGVSARYGVQDFIVLLPETSCEDASKLADSIREEMSSTAFDMTNAGLKISVTISCGVAQIHDDDTVDTLVDRAVQALYLARKRGRNRVISE